MSDDVMITAQMSESSSEPSSPGVEGTSVPTPPQAPDPTAVSSNKAAPIKRVIATFIDSIIISIVSLIAAYIIGFIPVLGSLFGPMITQIVWSVLFLLKDSTIMPDGISPAKRLLGIRAVDNAGNPLEAEASVKRNLPLAAGSLITGAFSIVPVLGPFFGGMIGGVLGLILTIVELFFMFTDPEGLRYGDRFAGTKVVNS